jgi:hypothetical protein
MLQQGKDAPCLVGYLTFEIGDTGELIQRLDYVEELPGLEDLIIEMPETLDLPEWEVWPSDER